MFFSDNKTTKLSLLLVVFVSIQTLSWSVEPDKDLLLYFPMEKDVSDASGNKNDGELDGKMSLVKGKFGKAIQLLSDQPIVVMPSESISASSCCRILSL